MRTRREGVLFTVVVTLAMLVGAGLIGLVLVGQGAPGAVVVGTLLAAIPVAPLIGCYLWLDRYEPEPRSLLVLGLGWGAFVATSAALLLQIFDHFLLDATRAFEGTVVAPLTEEAAKGVFVLLLLFFRRRELDGILDGIVYAGMVGIGFAFTENILYLTSAYLGEHGSAGGIGDAVQIFILRCVFSPFAHPFFTAFTGIGIGLAVTTRSHLVRFLAPVVGYAIAVVLHGMWNASLMLHGGSGAAGAYVLLMVPAFLLVVGFAIWARQHERRILTTALLDCARRGFLDPREIPWLVGLGARRACRANARRVAGPAGEKAMADYQHEAIKLGFLHHRFLRGSAPAGFAAQGQEYVDNLRSLRPSLVWPHMGRPLATGAARPSGGSW
ncbi:MAG TPA: PrsW family intramembrane metalloprotease [Marmoricola sp.]|nr:PrsW family intramembrane metalloprotease [Marmoricola sp.]